MHQLSVQQKIENLEEHRENLVKKIRILHDEVKKVDQKLDKMKRVSD